MTHIKIYILGEGITAKALRAFVKQYDYVVENDILEKSYKEVFKLVNNFINE